MYLDHIFNVIFKFNVRVNENRCETCGRFDDRYKTCFREIYDKKFGSQTI